MTPLIVPLASGAELRVVFDVNGADLQCWRRHADGRYMMGGAFWVTANDLRLVRHGLAAAILTLTPSPSRGAPCG